VSTLLHATVYVTHNLLKVLVHIANKMGLQKKKYTTQGRISIEAVLYFIRKMESDE
jgi:hypothetical protein